MNNDLKDAIRVTLLELFPLWDACPKQDYKRVVRRLENSGSYNLSLELVAGAHTWYGFMAAYRNVPSIISLENEIRKSRPELFSYLIGFNMAMLIQDAWTYVRVWFDFLAEKSHENDLEQNISLLISELDRVLEEKSVQAKIISPICGLKISDHDTFEEFAFSDDIVIRRVQDREFEEIMSSDVHANTIGSGCFMPDVSYLLEYRVIFPVRFSSESSFLESSELRKNYEETALLIQAFHLVGAGKITILKNYTQYKLKVLPWSGFSTSNTLLHHAFQSMEINASDLLEVKKVFDQLRECKNKQLILAASRLTDAEQRVNPADALLDSFIGLEAILNSGKTEASYRICLNYSFLSEEKDRKNRFDLMNKIYGARSKVVHGDFSLEDIAAGDIHENAKLAKLCLREVLEKLLDNRDVRSSAKINKKFWEGRILGDVS